MDVQFEDLYDIGKEIGMGSYSFVHLATHKQTKCTYAVKIIDKSLLTSKERDRIGTEVEIHKTCKHENIVSLEETFETKHRLYIVMEAMKGGDLFDRLVKKKVYAESEARVVIQNIVKAVLYLHERGLVHRDLKPENMLLVSKSDHVSIKIADFGFSKNIEDGFLTTPCGSPGYVAPEIANEQAYTTGVDMWSVGVILYTMLVGYPPFYSDDSDQLLELVSEGKISFPSKHWKYISNDAKDLIKRLLEKNTAKRYTAQQVLQHTWIISGPETIENKTEAKPRETDKDFELTIVRGAVNKCIDLQRDGCLLRSATESSIFMRRKKRRQQQQEQRHSRDLAQPIHFTLDL